jgi:hypothetical protein
MAILRTSLETSLRLWKAISHTVSAGTEHVRIAFVIKQTPQKPTVRIYQSQTAVGASVYSRFYNLANCVCARIYIYIYIYIYLLTPWSRVLLKKLTGFAANQEIPPHFMEPESSLPYSQAYILYIFNIPYKLQYFTHLQMFI